MALPSRFLLLAAVLSIVVAATDAAAQTVTLSVPSGTTLAEGGGSVDITVTATLSSVRTSETTITLSLGGTARATDYTVQSLPQITIAMGQTQSTATVVLTAVDDSFYEGPESLAVNGSASGLNVTAASVELQDNDTLPRLSVSGRQIQLTEGGASRTVTVEIR